MTVYSGHLKDDHLVECYFATRLGDSVDPRLAEHLTDCAACLARYDEVAAFMAAARHDAERETDALFTAERLHAQQEQIMRRLEQVQRPARVISFPSREAATTSPSVAHLTPRWLAAAAAAGLFIGVAVGGYVVPDRLHRASTTVQSTAPAPPMAVQPRPVSTGAVLVSTQPEADDDAFLQELELALARPHTRELQPFDAMTPHARDIDNRER
ncbi:MAG TPA: hypothetical protein VM032_14535 [Vicinamibacterales bacterium]|nr:hypothetical protein [Vicinamibacterales bacterium]